MYGVSQLLRAYSRLSQASQHHDSLFRIDIEQLQSCLHIHHPPAVHARLCDLRRLSASAPRPPVRPLLLCPPKLRPEPLRCASAAQSDAPFAEREAPRCAVPKRCEEARHL